MKTQKIQINTKTKKYSIFIGSKLIAQIQKILSSQKLSFAKTLIVIDKNIPSKFKFNLIKNIKSGVKKIYIFDANEWTLKYEKLQNPSSFSCIGMHCKQCLCRG